MSTSRHPPVQHPLYNEQALRTLGVAPRQQTKTSDFLPSDHVSGRVVIGFVDYGFDLLHPCLLDGSGTKSRFKYLWDQNRTPDLVRQPNCPLSTIYDYAADDLNLLIAAAQNGGDRSILDTVYDAHANYYGRAGVINGAHGTQMASMAAGTAFAGFRSAAPFADLIGVQLAVADTDWREETAAGEPAWRRETDEPSPHGCTHEFSGTWNGWRSYDACPQIVHAIHYIYDRASRLGAELVVINLSIGTWAGAHDGQSPVEQAIAKVIDYGRRPGATACKVVVGAGNAGAEQGHFTATLTAGDSTTFQWMMNCKDPSQNKLEIWYDGTPLHIELTGPTPECEPLKISVGGTHAINLGTGVGSVGDCIESCTTRVGIADHVTGVRGDLSRVRILLHPPYMEKHNTDRCETLQWAVTVRKPKNTGVGCSTVHAWIERDDGLIERSWLTPHHPDSTLCCLATAPGVMIVGGINHQTSDGTVHTAPFSSRGPAPWAKSANRLADAPTSLAALAAPNNWVVAPACNIWGAQSKTAGFAQTSGTSAAAALMSGAVAARHEATLPQKAARSTRPQLANCQN